MGKLDGKITLITGGTEGMGFATAQEFVAEGAFVFVTGRRQAEVDKAAAQLGKNAHGIAADAGKVADIERMYTEIKAMKGRLDVVFANAGVYKVVPWNEMTEEEYDRIFAINARGVFFIVQKAIPLMQAGGQRLPQPGYFFQPTVVTDATPDMKIVREEIFGPVGCVTSFSTLEEAIAKSNATEYGLAASVWTSDLGNAQAMMRGLKAGMVWVNTMRGLKAGMVWVNTHFELDVTSPFGGYKQSGIGRELGEESIYEFMQTKSVLMRPS